MVSGTKTTIIMRLHVIREENWPENRSRSCKNLKTGWKRPARRNEMIRIEKKGQSRRPRSRNDTRKSNRKYLKTRGLNGFSGLVAGLVSINMILEVLLHPVYPFS
jgi:hypothetical protein